MRKQDVLIFEDDAIINWHLQSLLTSFGLSKSKICKSKADAALAILSHEVDIIFLNLKLEDGWIEEAFIHDCLQRTALLIILTGYGNFKPGVLYHEDKFKMLKKPFHKFQLKSLLTEFL